MEINTPIAEDIHVTDQHAQYDACCKRLLSQKIILAWILKSCLKEYQDCDTKDIAEKYIEGQPQISKVPVEQDETIAPRVHGISSEDTSLHEGTSIYDIRFLAVVPSSGELIQLIIDLEAQNEFKPGYPLLKRAVYYCGRMLTAQKGTEFVHSEYQKIKKVVSIWVCMAPPDDRKNSITRYHMTEENVVGNVKEQVRNYDLIEVIILCLGGEDRENYEGVLKLLDVLLSPTAGEAKKRQVLQQEFEIPMTETLEEEVRLMCNLSQGVRNLGRAEGRAEGRVEGRAEGLLTSIRNLMVNTGWPMERAMDVLGVPDTERPKYADLLKKQ